MSIKKKFDSYRDNFNLRFNQYFLFVGTLLLIFYTILILTGEKKNYTEIPVKLLSALAIILVGYILIFFVQVPLYKRLTRKYISKLQQINVTIDKLKDYNVKERTNTFAMLNFYVPEYVISFFNNEHQCNFELISVRELPPFAGEDLTSWVGKSIIIYVDPNLLNKRSGTQKPIKIFNFKGMGYDLDKSFFRSTSEYVSTLPKHLIFYVLFPIITFGVFMLAIMAFAFVHN